MTRRRVIMIALISLAVAGWTGTASASGRTSISASDSQLIVQRFDRIRRASSLTVFQVDGYQPNCRPWTFPQDRVIDCHPIIQQVEAPSSVWRDSLVNLITAPGALTISQAKVCVCSDDIVLRFAVKAETTTVWLCTGCGTIGIPTPVSIMGFDLTIQPGLLQTMLYAVLPGVVHESRNEFVYHETPPVLTATPKMPKQLRIPDGATRADTLKFEARVDEGGLITELLLDRGGSGLDSLAAEFVKGYRYQPARGSRGQPVASWIVIDLRVPKVPR